VENDQIINYLLRYGGASIRYRVKRDILNEPADTPEMTALYEELLSKKRTVKLTKNQYEDGWFGSELHGGHPAGMDISIYLLLSYGIEKNDPMMRKAIGCILDPTSGERHKKWMRGGMALDEDGRGGNDAVIAGLLGMLGSEDNEYVIKQIKLSLDHMAGALKHEQAADFTKTAKNGTLYYMPCARFPGANHLSLLNDTFSWRTKENMECVKRSISHCFKLMKNVENSPVFKNKDHIVGPFNYDWHVDRFTIDDIKNDTYSFIWWWRSLYLVSGLDHIYEVSEFKHSYDYLRELLYSGDIYLKQTEMSLKRMKDIFSLEDNWKNQTSMICDFLFAGIIVMKNIGSIKDQRI
jgi:hypothetical protein